MTSTTVVHMSHTDRHDNPKDRKPGLMGSRTTRRNRTRSDQNRNAIKEQAE